MLLAKSLVEDLQGPIVVTGATGFIGAQLLFRLQTYREDVHGFAREVNSWRAGSLDLKNLVATRSNSAVIAELERIRPKVIFNLAAHGAYSHQNSADEIFETNFHLVRLICEWAEQNDATVVQAGSSSEYGWNSEAPDEGGKLSPNSVYAVSKASASQWIEHLVRLGDLNACTLRLYSVYGPLEDPGRLVPTLIRSIRDERLPPLAAKAISRDYVYIDDVVEAFVRAALHDWRKSPTCSLNICTGVQTTMESLADLVKAEFSIQESPQFGAFSRAWDLERWYGNSSRARSILGWVPKTTLREGLRDTYSWYTSENRQTYLESTPEQEGMQSREFARPDISAVIACYRDAEAMPYMYRRLVETFDKIGATYEIIFVNDASPDDAGAILLELTALDADVIGICHSRNFGSQAAFLSGMEIATGEYVVLLDGDLQDPPELIEAMWKAVHEGYDVAYGRRVDREAPKFMKVSYKLFYRVFDRLAPFKIPRDAGDFSLMHRSVVVAIRSMPERDLFIRAQRAYVGYRQIGIDYVRPERMFGTSTNNIGKNLGWATRGVLAVSRAPLTALSLFSLGLFGISIFLIFAQVLTKLFWPSIAPQGIVSLSVLIVGLGSLNLLAVAIVGEYIGRILEETKRRPRYFRSSLIRNGLQSETTSRDGSLNE